MRLMGLDYGSRTIGVAISDAFGWTAQGLEVIRRDTSEKDLSRIKQLIIENEVTEIVVGLPKNMNGTIGLQAEQCIEFADHLKEMLDLPIHLWDERLTTAAVTRTLIEADVSRKKRKLVVDKMAAGLILQGFLDSKRKR